jgi:type I restriction enzyme S subunit
MSDLPAGWSWATIEQLAAREPNAITDGPFGSKLKTSDYVDEGPRVVRLGNIRVGEFVAGDRVCISVDKFNTLHKHEVSPGDLVVAALAEPVGRCAQIPADLGPAIVKADCVRVKVHPHLDSRFVMYSLNSPQGLRRAEEAAHGIGRLRMNLGDLRGLPVALAPANEQRRIVAKLGELLTHNRRAGDSLCAYPFTGSSRDRVVA